MITRQANPPPLPLARLLNGLCGAGSKHVGGLRTPTCSTKKDGLNGAVRTDITHFATLNRVQLFFNGMQIL